MMVKDEEAQQIITAVLVEEGADETKAAELGERVVNKLVEYQGLKRKTNYEKAVAEGKVGRKKKQ